MLRSETYRLQQQLVSYCRNGNLTEIPGTVKNRLPHYRRLISSIMKDALVTAFPITRQVFSDEEWDNLVFRFIREKDVQTPLLWQMPYSFYEYCQENNLGMELERPYLNDLLYFEWIEIEIFNMPDRQIPHFKDNRDFLNRKIVLNPEYEIIFLEYPVFKMAVGELENHKGEYFLMVYRDLKTLSVQFIELSPATVWLIQAIETGEKTGRQIMQEAGSVLNIDPKTISEISDSLFIDFYEKGIILGTQ